MKSSCAWLLIVALVAPACAAPVCWKLQPAASHLRFVGDQAGAPAHGEFGRFTANFCFDPATATGHLRVVVDTASLQTHNSRRDEVLKGADFFAVKRHPTAVYAADKFAPGGNGSFVASGTLSLKGVTRQVPVTFRIRMDAAHGAEVTGNVTLHRMHFGVGTGRWGNTRWVGSDVALAFELHFAQVEGGGDQPPLHAHQP